MTPNKFVILIMSTISFQMNFRMGRSLLWLQRTPNFSLLHRQTMRMNMSSFKRAGDIDIPLDKVQIAFTRSSGPGGQNVNKLSTKAEIRFNVASAEWIPVEVRARLSEYHSNKMNKEGELIVTSQEHRTQAKNKEDCIAKIQSMLAEAYLEPKDRHMWEGISEKGKEIRRQEKKQRGLVKDSRRMKNFNDSDY